MRRAAILMMSLAACSHGPHGTGSNVHAVLGGSPSPVSGKAYTFWTYTSTDQTNATVHPQLDGKQVVLDDGYSSWDAEIRGDGELGFELPAGVYTLGLDIGKQATPATLEPNMVYWVRFYGDSGDPQLRLWTDDDAQPVHDTYHLHIFNMGPDKLPVDVSHVSANAVTPLATGLPYGAGVDVDVAWSAGTDDNITISSPALAPMPLPRISYSASVGIFGYRLEKDQIAAFVEQSPYPVFY
jgi:hypothetical protein